MGFLRPIATFMLLLLAIIAVSAIMLGMLSFCQDVMRVYDPLG